MTPNEGGDAFSAGETAGRELNGSEGGFRVFRLVCTRAVVAVGHQLVLTERICEAGLGCVLGLLHWVAGRVLPFGFLVQGSDDVSSAEIVRAACVAAACHRERGRVGRIDAGLCSRLVRGAALVELGHEASLAGRVGEAVGGARASVGSRAFGGGDLGDERLGLRLVLVLDTPVLGEISGGDVQAVLIEVGLEHPTGHDPRQVDDDGGRHMRDRHHPLELALRVYGDVVRLRSCSPPLGGLQAAGDDGRAGIAMIVDTRRLVHLGELLVGQLVSGHRLVLRSVLFHDLFDGVTTEDPEPDDAGIGGNHRSVELLSLAIRIRVRRSDVEDRQNEGDHRPHPPRQCIRLHGLLPPCRAGFLTFTCQGPLPLTRRVMRQGPSGLVLKF